MTLAGATRSEWCRCTHCTRTYAVTPGMADGFLHSQNCVGRMRWLTVDEAAGVVLDEWEDDGGAEWHWRSNGTSYTPLYVDIVWCSTSLAVEDGSWHVRCDRTHIGLHDLKTRHLATAKRRALRHVATELGRLGAPARKAARNPRQWRLTTP